MIISNPTRYSQSQSKLFQDSMDPSGQLWRSENLNRTDKQSWLSMNTNNNNNFIMNHNSLSYASANANNSGYQQVPFGDQIYPAAIYGRSQERRSPSTSIHLFPPPNQQLPQNNSHYQLTNFPGQDLSTISTNTALYDNPIDVLLPQPSAQYQMIVPQPSPLEARASSAPSKDGTFFRTSRANSATSVPSRFSTRLKSDASVTSRSSDEDGNYQKKSKRSRLGCLTCRHRKKRCCETKPRCTECSRLGLNCSWPIPGTEHKNRSKNNRISHDEMYHAVYGHIKILRGVVEYKVNE